MSSSSCDIFFSLRFNAAGPMKEAKLLQAELAKVGVNAMIIEVMEGDNVKDVVIEMLDQCKLAVLFATADYGAKGSVDFSTKEELQFILDEKKPFFLIKMCDRYDTAKTRFDLPNSILYSFWPVGQPMPTDLVAKVIAKYQQAIEPNKSINVLSITSQPELTIKESNQLEQVATSPDSAADIQSIQTSEPKQTMEDHSANTDKTDEVPDEGRLRQRSIAVEGRVRGASIASKSAAEALGVRMSISRRPFDEASTSAPPTSVTVERNLMLETVDEDVSTSRPTTNQTSENKSVVEKATLNPIVGVVVTKHIETEVSAPTKVDSVEETVTVPKLKKKPQGVDKDLDSKKATEEKAADGPSMGSLLVGAWKVAGDVMWTKNEGESTNSNKVTTEDTAGSSQKSATSGIFATIAKKVTDDEAAKKRAIDEAALSKAVGDAAEYIAGLWGSSDTSTKKKSTTTNVVTTTSKKKGTGSEPSSPTSLTDMFLASAWKVVEETAAGSPIPHAGEATALRSTSSEKHQNYEVIIPNGVKPNEKFTCSILGQLIYIKCPKEKRSGQKHTFLY